MNVPCKRVHLLECDLDKDLDYDADHNPDNFAPCKLDISLFRKVDFSQFASVHM